MLSEHALAAPALDYASGSASRNGSAIDVRGYAGCAFAIHLATVASGSDHTVKLQGSNDGSTWVDLEGWSYAINSDALSDALTVVDVGHPRHRYLRLALTKDATNNSGESAIAYRYKANREPVEYADPLTATATRLHAPEAVAS